MKILYVEDDPHDADLTRRALAKSAPQFELDIVATVREARERLKDDAERYDLALIDLKLPDGDGLDLLGHIRERSLSLATLIVTGRGDEEAAVAALKAGADDYVVKRKDYLAHLPLTLEDAFRRAQARTARHARLLRALYAEHNATDIDLTQRHLARHAPHIHLDVVHTAAEALQRLSDTPEAWDILLLDYNLPGMTALEVLKNLRQRQRLDIPIVLVTGRGDEDVAVQALKLGAADYLIKSAGYLFRLPYVLEDAFHRDQLARERAALRESERRYRNIFDGVQDAIFVESLSGEILNVNARACEMFGYSRDEFLTKTVEDLVPPGEFALIPEELAGDEMPVQPVETVNVRANGERFPVEITGQLQTVDGEAVLLVVVRDITERKRVEEALQQHAERLATLHQIDRAILEAQSPEKIAQAALSHLRRLVSCTAAAVATFDLEAQEATLVALQAGEEFALDVGTRIPMQGIAAEIEALRQDEILATKDITALSKAPPAMQALQAVGLRSYIAAPLSVDGELLGALGLGAERPEAFSAPHTDIVRETADQVAVALHQARLRADLETERQRLEALVEHVPEGILLLDTERRILLANPTAEGYLASLTDARPGQVLSRLANRSLEELETPPPEGRWHALEVSGPPQRLFEALVRPVVESKSQSSGWVLTMRDVTEERRAQEHVQRQERLAAVGQLAAGIAHDFNNIMAVIVLYTQMGLRLPDIPVKLRERLQTISRQAKSATDLIQQILDFSRRAVLERRAMDLVPLLKEVVKLLERTLPESIRVSFSYDTDAYTVNADPTRMQQIIMNLAFNARDAMPKGGKLHIALDRVQIREHERPPLPDMVLASADPGQWARDVEAGEWVRITVSDTGAGITPEVLKHVFEPFFTTKAPGEGSGLGLAQVYGIVKQHEGHIDVETKVGEGTAFIIYLPSLVTESLEPSFTEPRDVVTGHRETILVVEDDDSTRLALTDCLELLDYQVLAAATGREALAVFEEHGDEVALVLTDVVMPAMGGIALFHALKQKDAAVKVIFLTGHSMEEKLEDLRSQGLTSWIAKPPDLKRLAQEIDRALQKNSRTYPNIQDPKKE